MTAEINQHDLAAARKLECKADYLYFFRYFFKQRTGAKALINWHHFLMAKTLARVLAMEIPRLIITIPPGYTKTELAVVSFMAYGLTLNPRSRFMHLSYSDTLALLNSSQTRNIVKSKEYQEMWPTELRDDTDSKKLWWTKEGGGVYATSMGGQVTGFRAGQMEPGFTGALIIDDGLKPDDAYTVERDNANRRYTETISSRIAHPSVPIILIMQRIHYKDMAGFLLQGGSGEMWHHLELPVDFPADPYPEEYTHGIPIEYDPPGEVLWETKHSKKDIEVLKSKPRLYSTQYKQRPPRAGSMRALWADSDVERARQKLIRGILKRTVVAVDPSVTANKDSDEVGIVVAGAHDNSHIIGQSEDDFEVMADLSGVIKAADWVKIAIDAYNQYRANAIVVETNNGGDLIELALRNSGFTGAVIKVHAKDGKYLRAEPVAPFYKLNRVKHREGLTELESEMLDFELGMLKSPNRVDALVYALTELSNPTGTIGW